MVVYVIIIVLSFVCLVEFLFVKGISTHNLIIAAVKELLRVRFLFKARENARKWRQVTGNQTLSMFI